MSEEQNAILKAFKTHGRKASYHFADDSGVEWQNGYASKKAALKIFDENPELHEQMRKIAVDFLWSLKTSRPSKIT